jgi:NTP pyrophosphatase (non-canonical NTP hydrolase)
MPDNDEVICPKCAEQFRAIPVNIQKTLVAAGFAPPFLDIPKLRSTGPYGKLLSEDAMRETSGNASLQQAIKMPKAPPVGVHMTSDLFPLRLLVQTDEQAIQQLVDLVHFMNKRLWVDLKTNEPVERNFGELLMLAVSELGEALEADRKNLMDDKLPHRPGREVEIADCIIRLLDTAGGLKLDVAGALVEKLAFNARREDHTREHRLSEHGKKY